MNRKFYIILLFLCNIIFPIFGYIYKIEQWQNHDKSIYLFYDFHHDVPLNICHSQTKDILLSAKALNANVIVEDPATPMEGMKIIFQDPLKYESSNYHRSREELEKVKNCTTSRPLESLASRCHYNGIDNKGIEFRSPKRVSLWGYINACFALNVSNKIAEEIKCYDDNEILDAYYKIILDIYYSILEDCKDFFETLNNSEKSIKDTLPFLTYKDQYYNALEKAYGTIPLDWSSEKKKEALILYYDSKLLDARILHNMYQSINENVFILAGGVHIKNVAQALKNLDYENVKTLGEDYGYNSIGNIISPDAVIIKEFFKDKIITELEEFLIV